MILILCPLSNQGLFNALDGAMMVVALYILNVLHPGFLLPKAAYKNTGGSSPSLVEMKSRA